MQKNSLVTLPFNTNYTDKDIIDLMVKYFPSHEICVKASNKASSVMVKTLPFVTGIQSTNTDLYFYIHGCNKATNITNVYCNFVDLDAGRTPTKQYHDRHTVDIKKQGMAIRIDAFSKDFAKPTLIVETRNGFHLYWCYSQQNLIQKKDINQWHRNQKRIWSYFKSVGADYNVLKINQIMRVPGTTWYKPYENMNETFQCNFIDNNVLHDYKSFSDNLKKIAIKRKPKGMFGSIISSAQILKSLKMMKKDLSSKHYNVVETRLDNLIILLDR